MLMVLRADVRLAAVALSKGIGFPSAVEGINEVDDVSGWNKGGKENESATFAGVLEVRDAPDRGDATAWVMSSLGWDEPVRPDDFVRERSISTCVSCGKSLYI